MCILSLTFMKSNLIMCDRGCQCKFDPGAFPGYNDPSDTFADAVLRSGLLRFYARFSETFV